jgi:hypothetical protein
VTLFGGCMQQLLKWHLLRLMMRLMRSTHACRFCAATETAGLSLVVLLCSCCLAMLPLNSTCLQSSSS